MINDDLRVRLSVSKGGDTYCGIPMSIISMASDSARFSTEMRAFSYLLSILGYTLFLDKSALPVVSYELWPIVKSSEVQEDGIHCCSNSVVIHESWIHLTFKHPAVRRFLITVGGMLLTHVNIYYVILIYILYTIICMFIYYSMHISIFSTFRTAD